MVSKASEYRREYRPASLVKNIPTYYESLTYRHHRRELEYAHTPISWESDLDDKTEAPDEEDIPVVNLKIDEKDEKKDSEKEEGMKNEEEEEVNDAEEELEEEEIKKEKIVNNDEQKEPLEAQDKSDVLIERQTSQSRELTKLAKNKLKKYSCTENKNIDRKKPSQDKYQIKEEFLAPKKVDEEIFVKRPKRPDRSKPMVPRPRTACSSSQPQESRDLPSASPRPSSSASCDRPPFVLYGSGDSELKMGNKRTHNVYCSTDIYPAAVKARQQNYIRAKKLEDLRKKILIQKKKQKNMQVSKISKETSAWHSEYQNQYPTYDKEEYARRLRALEFARARKVKCDL